MGRLTAEQRELLLLAGVGLLVLGCFLVLLRSCLACFYRTCCRPCCRRCCPRCCRRKKEDSDKGTASATDEAEDVPRGSLKDLPFRRESAPVVPMSRSSTEFGVQTEPCFLFEPVVARPVPLRLVLLVDSSASVGERNFERVKAFLSGLLAELAPESKVGVLRFESRYSIISSLQTPRVARVALEEMEYVAGETVMGKPIAMARKLLDTDDEDRRQGTVFVVTDGKPNDWEEAREEAAGLRAAGHRLCFLAVDSPTEPGAVERWSGALTALASAPDPECTRTVWPVKSGFEALEQRILLNDVLSNLVRVEQEVFRAKTTLHFAAAAAQNRQDFDAAPGLELILRRPQPLGDTAPWAPRPVQGPRIIDDGRSAEAQTDVVESADAGCDALGAAVTTKESDLQTDPTVVGEVAKGEADPVDLVLLVDSSASVGATSFRAVKEMLLALTGRLPTPPSRVALVRFESNADTLLGFERDRAVIYRAIQEMAYVVGETKLAPALKAAMRLIDPDETARNPANAAAVLCVTDGDPNDRNAALAAAAALREKASLVFVGVGPDVSHATLTELAGRADRVVHAPSFAALDDIPFRALELILSRPLVVVRAKALGVRLAPDQVRTVSSVDELEGTELTTGVEVVGSSSPVQPQVPRDAAATQHCLAAILDDLRQYSSVTDGRPWAPLVPARTRDLVKGWQPMLAALDAPAAPAAPLQPAGWLRGFAPVVAAPPLGGAGNAPDQMV